MALKDYFTATCNKCGGNKIIVDAFSHSSMCTLSGTISLPLIYCEECGNEWNPLMRVVEQEKNKGGD